MTASNHKSALRFKDRVEKRLIEEIEDGNFVPVTSSKVTLVSPLAAIEKDDKDVRLIHDLSVKNSLNHFADKEECKYESLSDTIQMLQPHFWMAKVDLKWAYRSMPIKPEHYTLTGLQWTFKGNREPTTLVDTAFPFGARKSPSHFNRITKAVKRMMTRRHFNCQVYLDDFLLFEDSFEKCSESLATLISLLRKLSFRINWKKVVDPCQKINFLGVTIDTINGTLELDPPKVDKLIKRIKSLVGKKRVSKKALQCIGGHLTWACNVIHWGRAHMNSIFQAIRNLNSASHKMRITPWITSDLQWWISSLQHNQPWRALWPKPQPSVIIESDSCLASGGAFLKRSNAWIYTNWLIDRPHLANAHINTKELAMIREAINAWGPYHPNHHFQIYCDNITAVHMTNTGAARHPLSASILKDIAHMAMKWDLTITALYLPGYENQLADSISRLHQPGQLLRLSALLNAETWPNFHPPYNLCYHMSPLTLFFLLPQVLKMHAHYNSWIKRLLNFDSTHLQPPQRKATIAI